MDTFARLEQLPKATAEQVSSSMSNLGLDHYKRFLNMMYHYTKKSGARLEWAAQHSPHDDLRAFFAQLAKEEAGHYKLAEADLRALGEGIASDDTPGEVRDFERFWEGLGTQRFCGYLGALYVLENVGEHMQEAALRSLGALPLKKEQVRFIMVHLQDDVEHGARTAALCKKYAAIDAEAMLAGAEQASHFWASMLRAAFSGA
jgi:heme oxygenase